MAKRGRKSKYDEYVKPRLKDVKIWAETGATDAEICKALGIHVSTFCEYKKQFPELCEALRTGRQVVVLNIKAALYKRATGFNYVEKVGRTKGEDVQTEIYERYTPPDPTAAAMLLRNYDQDWRDKDKQTADFRRQEIAIKKALAESNNFVNLDNIK